MRKSYQMRTRKGKIVFWSILPHKVTFETSSTQPFKWIRLGLIPGFGDFRSSESVFSFLTFIWVKAPENRTLAISWGKKDNEPLTIEQREIKNHKIPK
jgi:hypothetical protein